MNRKNIRNRLEGVIYDNACNTQKFCLNRDPQRFKYLRFIVDGCHFQGQKKFKKKDSKSSGNGHLGCSNSYNFMEYKKFTSNDKDGASNYQGREQLHSILKPLAPALRQMSYPNFMRTLIIFFGIRNLITMKKLKNSDLDF